MTDNPRPLSSLELVVSESMRGSKRAVRVGNTIYVSPAMYDLIRHADQDELRRLLGQIPMLDFSAFVFDPTKPLPMTTQP